MIAIIFVASLHSLHFIRELFRRFFWFRLQFLPKLVHAVLKAELQDKLEQDTKSTNRGKMQREKPREKMREDERRS